MFKKSELDCLQFFCVIPHIVLFDLCSTFLVVSSISIRFQVAFFHLIPPNFLLFCCCCTYLYSLHVYEYKRVSTEFHGYIYTKIMIYNQNEYTAIALNISWFFRLFTSDSLWMANVHIRIFFDCRFFHCFFFLLCILFWFFSLHFLFVFVRFLRFFYSNVVHLFYHFMYNFVMYYKFAVVFFVLLFF